MNRSSSNLNYCLTISAENTHSLSLLGHICLSRISFVCLFSDSRDNVPHSRFRYGGTEPYPVSGSTGGRREDISAQGESQDSPVAAIPHTSWCLTPTDTSSLTPRLTRLPTHRPIPQPIHNRTSSPTPSSIPPSSHHPRTPRTPCLNPNSYQVPETPMPKSQRWAGEWGSPGSRIPELRHPYRPFAPGTHTGAPSRRGPALTLPSEDLASTSGSAHSQLSGSCYGPPGSAEERPEQQGESTGLLS